MFMIKPQGVAEPPEAPKDEDVMEISGAIPVVDLSSANAVIDEERAENAKLREQLAKQLKNEAANKEVWKAYANQFRKEAETLDAQVNGEPAKKAARHRRVMTALAFFFFTCTVVLGINSVVDRDTIDSLVAKNMNLAMQVSDVMYCRSVTVHDVSELPSGRIDVKVDRDQAGLSGCPCGERHYYVNVWSGAGTRDAFWRVPRALYDQLEPGDVIEKTSAFTAIRRAAR